MWSAWPGAKSHPGRPIACGATSSATLPPYRTDDRVLFVCFVGNAELHCHLALGWPLPRNVLDLNAEFRCVTNGRTAPAGKGLLGRAAPISDLDDASTANARTRCAAGSCRAGRSRRKSAKKFCATAPATWTRCASLLPRMLPEIELPIALHRGEFVAVSAQMEHRGVPIDMEIFPQLADTDAWRYVRDAMVPTIDADYGVYVQRR